MRCTKYIIEATHQRHRPVDDTVLIDSEQLLIHDMLLDSVVMIKPRLGPPADMNGGGYMGGGPVHDLRQLRPVIHILKLHLLHRCAGDDHTVKLLLPDLIKGHIKLV